MNWKKPTLTEYPPFKQIVLGLKFPNTVDLVMLDRIDENGPVFLRATERPEGQILNIFMGATRINIDRYAIIELPDEATKKSETPPSAEKEEPKEAKAKDQPLHS